MDIITYEIQTIQMPTKCKQITGVEIIYGLPSSELADAEERGEVELGGCEVDDNNPKRTWNAVK